jgi:aspartate racemase
MEAQDYAAVGELFVNAALHMKQGGAEGIVICANTMHMFAGLIEQRTGLPVIHMVTATAKAINAQGLKTVALLGTRPTMDLPFYKEKLAAHGIQTILPSEADKDYIHANIFEELSRGIFTQPTRERYIGIIKGLVAQGAEGIILGCTDIPPLISQGDVSVPVFDTTRLHAEAVLEFYMGEDGNTNTTAGAATTAAR